MFLELSGFLGCSEMENGFLHSVCSDTFTFIFLHYCTPGLLSVSLSNPENVCHFDWLILGIKWGILQKMMEIMIVPSKMMMTVLCVDCGDRGDFGDQRHH